MKTTDQPIAIEIAILSTSQKVWQALTDVSQMNQWFFEQIPSFDPIIGFNTQFEVHVEDRTFTHLWEVTAVDQAQRISYNWKYLEYAGDAIVTFKLKENEMGSILLFSMQVLANFPDDIPEFKRESCEGGWHYFLNRLKAFIESL